MTGSHATLAMQKRLSTVAMFIVLTNWKTNLTWSTNFLEDGNVQRVTIWPALAHPSLLMIERLPRPRGDLL